MGNGTDEYLTYYNVDGSLADFKNRAYPVHVEELSLILPDMIRLAEKLSKDFPIVRVDLFDINGKIILSELTFTPGGAIIPIDPVDSDRSWVRFSIFQRRCKRMESKINVW